MLKPFLITPVLQDFSWDNFNFQQFLPLLISNSCRCWSVLIIGSLLTLLAGAYALFSEK